jgi:hypothetical protein
MPPRASHQEDAVQVGRGQEVEIGERDEQRGDVDRTGVVGDEHVAAAGLQLDAADDLEPNAAHAGTRTSASATS